MRLFHPTFSLFTNHDIITRSTLHGHFKFRSPLFPVRPSSHNHCQAPDRKPPGLPSMLKFLIGVSRRDFLRTEVIPANETTSTKRTNAPFAGVPTTSIMLLHAYFHAAMSSVVPVLRR